MNERMNERTNERTNERHFSFPWKNQVSLVTLVIKTSLRSLFELLLVSFRETGARAPFLAKSVQPSRKRALRKSVFSFGSPRIQISHRPTRTKDEFSVPPSWSCTGSLNEFLDRESSSSCIFPLFHEAFVNNYVRSSLLAQQRDRTGFRSSNRMTQLANRWENYGNKEYVCTRVANMRYAVIEDPDDVACVYVHAFRAHAATTTSRSKYVLYNQSTCFRSACSLLALARQ